MGEWVMGAEARARVSLEALAGRATTLKRGRGLCPLAGCKARVKPSGASEPATRKKRKSAASDPFWVKGDRWGCHKCGEHGDVIDLEQALRGGTPAEAARRLLGMTELPAATAPARKASRDDGPSATARVAAELWRGARPFAGSIGEVYLRARGIAAEVVAACAGNLRFHPRAKWWWNDQTRAWAFAPAMIALVVVAGPDGRPVATGGVHATYLTADGLAKAESEDAPSKAMWGPQGRDGKPGGTWLIGPSLAGHAGDGPTLEGLAVGAEGIETALSLATIHLRRTGSLPRAWAALSLDRLQGRLAKDDQKRVQADAPQADPDKPAFTWPGVARVRIGVDRDMSDLTLKAVTRRGKTCDVVLDAEARARLCARLSAAAWKAAGAVDVRAVAPSPGCDFNDELRRVLAVEMRRV
ncbi:MAG: hypothetical protein Q8S03_10250 [Brevundimonas sp.]|uniref:DUF7146 domain-containing protein n=1 Tax=Brevundimonas sp. TaxID=1871086 RepID=UPI0027366564|nr:hypothetical protein [Brevundimonas sp.]MDP3405060.1 hypothetical protein [Brevundimonas sp.]